MKHSELEDDFNSLAAMFEEKIESDEKTIVIDDRPLKTALVEQLKLQMDWETLSKRANNLYDLCEFYTEDMYAQALTKELRDAHYKCTISEAREFAKNDNAYRKAKHLQISVKELRDEIRGVLEVITSRKYVLNNISNIVISGSESHII